MSLTVDLVGSAAALLTTVAFVPQAWLTWKTHSVEGISLGMYSIFTLGVALWLLYGVLLGAWPIVAANTITLLLSGFILVTKLRANKRNSLRVSAAPPLTTQGQKKAP